MLVKNQIYETVITDYTAEGHADDVGGDDLVLGVAVGLGSSGLHGSVRSEEHTSELQSR